MSRSESIVRVLDIQYHFLLFLLLFSTHSRHRVCTQKAKAANFNLLELRCCCGFYITFNFSRLIFYSNVFPTDKLPLLECLTFSLCCRKSAKEKTSQKKAERKREGESGENASITIRPVGRAIVRGLDTPLPLPLPLPFASSI